MQRGKPPDVYKRHTIPFIKLLLLDFYILSILFERDKGSSSALIKFTEKFHILQTAGVHVGAQQVDRQVEHMSDDKYLSLIHICTQRR